MCIGGFKINLSLERAAAIVCGGLYTWVSRNSIIWWRTVNVTLMPGIRALT